MIEDSRKLSVAPMMDWTDRHCRFFLRLISKRSLLFTEMVTTGALLYGDVDRHLQFNEEEHPLALQLGGSDPEALAQSVRIARSYGYDEFNLNVGCPSDRVQNGRFGACLMAEPKLVGECISAMADAAGDIPVSVKCRIGIDEMEGYDPFRDFIDRVTDRSNCRIFYVHARKAWLQGLSPKENRDIPPLHYDFAHRLKSERPELQIMLNGGLLTLEQAEPHLAELDGVMIGRAAYQDPWILAKADRQIFGEGSSPLPDRHSVAAAMADYASRQQAASVPLQSVTRHLMGLFNGLRGARAWRRHLSENAGKPGATGDIIRQAAAFVECESTQAA